MDGRRGQVGELLQGSLARLLEGSVLLQAREDVEFLDGRGPLLLAQLFNERLPLVEHPLIMLRHQRLVYHLCLCLHGEKAFLAVAALNFLRPLQHLLDRVLRVELLLVDDIVEVHERFLHLLKLEFIGDEEAIFIVVLEHRFEEVWEESVICSRRFGPLTT